MEYAVIAIAYALVIILDFIPIIKKNRSNVIWVYSMLLAISMSLIILKLIIKPNMPSIAHILTNYIDKLFNIQ